jgi:hypothetical protein
MDTRRSQLIVGAAALLPAWWMAAHAGAALSVPPLLEAGSSGARCSEPSKA